MSLVDEARLEQEGRAKYASPCLFAEQVKREFARSQWPEVIEMMESDEFDSTTKLTVLANHGVVISKTSLLKKIRQGCVCQWCQDNWRGKHDVD